VSLVCTNAFNAFWFLQRHDNMRNRQDKAGYLPFPRRLDVIRLEAQVTAPKFPALSLSLILSRWEGFHEPPRLTNCAPEPPFRKSLEINPASGRFMGEGTVVACFDFFSACPANPVRDFSRDWMRFSLSQRDTTVGYNYNSLSR
jgi:hypothetical protein